MIPSCTIWAIRNSFPSENQEYTPFTKSNDDEDRTCQWKANNNYCQFYSCNVFRRKEPLTSSQTVESTCERVLQDSTL